MAPGCRDEERQGDKHNQMSFLMIPVSFRSVNAICVVVLCVSALQATCWLVNYTCTVAVM